MPKIKGLTKAERKRHKLESARSYYQRNREAVNERNRMSMQRVRKRASSFRRALRYLAAKEKQESADGRQAARRGTRMLAQWRQTLGSCDEMETDVGSPNEDKDEDGDSERSEGDIDGSGDGLKHVDNGERSMCDEGRNDPSESCKPGKQERTDYPGYHAYDPGKYVVAHQFPRATIPTSSIRITQMEVSKRRTVLDNLPPSSPPSYSDESEEERMTRRAEEDGGDSDRELPVCSSDDFLLSEDQCL